MLSFENFSIRILDQLSYCKGIKRTFTFRKNLYYINNAEIPHRLKDLQASRFIYFWISQNRTKLSERINKGT